MEFSLEHLQPKERASFALRSLYETAGCRKYHMGRFEEYSLYQENRSFLSSEQVITFTDLDGRLLGGSGEVVGAVARGDFLVGVTLEETALQRIAAGNTLALVYPEEGTSCVPDGTAVLKNAPHRESALAFLEFTLSQPVQTLLGSRFYRRSVRTDVTVPGNLPGNLNLIDYDISWVSENREGILRKWADAVKEGAA